MFSIRGGKIVQLLQLKQLDRRYDNSLVRPRYSYYMNVHNFDCVPHKHVKPAVKKKKTSIKLLYHRGTSILKIKSKVN